MHEKMDVDAAVRDVTQWIKEQIEESKGQGSVFGLSGGLDSAVIAALCRRVFPAEKCVGVYMPCYSDPEDRKDAQLVADTLDISWQEVPLEDTFDSLNSALDGIVLARPPRLARANMKPRLRMTVLYYLAAGKGLRVVGTSNRSETAIGYFTKYGDGAADLLPLADFLKKEVREMAFYLGIPEKIIKKAPSGGLWDGQTDEGELGFTYEQLDTYLAGGVVDTPLKARIEGLIQACQHKKELPPRYVRG